MARTVGRRGTSRGRPGSGMDRWLASWRFALRLGSREARRHPGRSLLIVALVATPVWLITSFLTFFSSGDITTEEGLDRELGTSAAAVAPSVEQVGSVLGSWTPLDAADHQVAPGYADTDPWDDGRVAATVGSPVQRVGHAEARQAASGSEHTATIDRSALAALVLDGPPTNRTAALASVVSGRWAQAADEVVVTRAGLARGLPESGPVSLVLGEDDEPTQLTVVGVAEAAFSPDRNADLVLTGEGAPAATAWQWLVDRSEPVGISEAELWAVHGLDVSSREILLNPTGTTQEWQANNDRATALYFSMIGLAVLIETVLLAGPAFAVSAARQRHSLALAGAQGAARADIRRAVIAYGLVLAVVATVAAAVVGSLLGLGGSLVLARLRPWQHVQPELPWVWVCLLMLASVVAAGVAAWWPARGATKLDLMSVLRGQVVSGRIARGWPFLGAAMTVAGLALLTGATQVMPQSASTWLMWGTVVLGLGVMLLVPAILALVSRCSGGAPLPWRLAARDSVRQRSRAVPALLATTAAVAVMAAVATVGVSATANQERQYTAQLPEGTLSVEGSTDNDAGPAITEAAAGSVPGATAYPLTWVPTGPGWDTETGHLVDRPVQAVVPVGCQPEDVTLTWADEPSACSIEVAVDAAVAPVEALEHSGALTAQMRQILEAGGLIVWADPSGAPSEDVGPGEALAVTAPARMLGQDGAAELTGPARLQPVPVYRATAQEMDALRISRTNVSGYLTPDTARSLGWTGVPGSVFIAGDRPMTLDQATALEEALAAEEALAPEDLQVYLERGFVPLPEDRLIPVIVLGVFSLIALAAVVISTALTISEGQQDSASLAAVGATRRTRRSVAAAHAVLVGAVGALLGTALGLVVGAVLSWTTTRMDYYQSGYTGWLGEDGIVAVPWLSLALAVLAIPLVASAVAWFSVRKDPVMTRVVT